MGHEGVKENLNPQAKEMADESMVRNLAAQAEAIWLQEKHLFDRYRLPVDANVLDAGCGTGEISLRLAQLAPHARVLGVDVIDMIATIHDPSRDGVWPVPGDAARAP